MIWIPAVFSPKLLKRELEAGTHRLVRVHPLACELGKWFGRCSFVWSAREAGAMSLLLVTAGWLAVTLYMVSTLHDLPHTISRHLFVLLYVPVVITAALSEDICQVEHLLKNV
jgi:formate hydrogenlyase subunit 3/multisubunit Na+/H+ antiporter MnhD subunit